MTKAVREVIQSPADLDAFIAAGGQRQNRVIIGLSQRIAHAKARAVFAVGGNERLIHVGMARFEPRGECRTKIKAHQGKVAQLRVGPITFVSNLLVEILERRRSWLWSNLPGEGILAGRLIKVSVDTQEFMYSVGHYLLDFP